MPSPDYENKTLIKTVLENNNLFIRYWSICNEIEPNDALSCIYAVFIRVHSITAGQEEGGGGQ